MGNEFWPGQQVEYMDGRGRWKPATVERMTPAGRVSIRPKVQTTRAGVITKGTGLVRAVARPTPVARPGCPTNCEACQHRGAGGCPCGCFHCGEGLCEECCVPTLCEADRKAQVSLREHMAEIKARQDAAVVPVVVSDQDDLRARIGVPAWRGPGYAIYDKLRAIDAEERAAIIAAEPPCSVCGHGYALHRADTYEGGDPSCDEYLCTCEGYEASVSHPYDAQCPCMPCQKSVIVIPRTADYSRNAERAGDNLPCAICGKVVKLTAPHYMVRTYLGGCLASDAVADANPSADSGYYPVGANCWRKHPEIHRYGSKVTVRDLAAADISALCADSPPSNTTGG